MSEALYSSQTIRELAETVVMPGQAKHKGHACMPRMQAARVLYERRIGFLLTSVRWCLLLRSALCDSRFRFCQGHGCGVVWGLAHLRGGAAGGGCRSL